MHTHGEYPTTGAAGRWIVRQRLHQRSLPISDVMWLDSILPGWDAPSKRGVRSRTRLWQRYAAALVEHKQAHGLYPTTGSAGRWIAKLRWRHNRQQLPPADQRWLDRVVPGWQQGSEKAFRKLAPTASRALSPHRPGSEHTELQPPRTVAPRTLPPQTMSFLLPPTAPFVRMHAPQAVPCQTMAYVLPPIVTFVREHAPTVTISPAPRCRRSPDHVSVQFPPTTHLLLPSTVSFAHKRLRCCRRAPPHRLLSAPRSLQHPAERAGPAQHRMHCAPRRLR